MNSAFPAHFYPPKSNPFFRIVIRFPRPWPKSWFCLVIILALSRPATPNKPMFILLWPSRESTRLFKDSQSGNPERTSSRMLPRLHTSKIKDTWAKSCTRTFVCCVKRFDKNEWISGGRYSGVLWTNSHWFWIVWPSSFKRKDDPRSIIFKVLID